MSTEKVTASPTAWVNLSTSASLINGTAYLVQNVGGSLVYIQESTLEPSDTTGAKHVLYSGGSPGDAMTLPQHADLSFFVRSLGVSVSLAVTEAA